jgi:hypothetical protein
MNYGLNKIIIRGTKFRVDIVEGKTPEENGTYVTSEFGVTKRISQITIHPTRRKQRIKEAWGLKK